MMDEYNDTYSDDFEDYEDDFEDIDDDHDDDINNGGSSVDNTKHLPMENMSPDPGIFMRKVDSVKVGMMQPLVLRAPRPSTAELQRVKDIRARVQLSVDAFDVFGMNPVARTLRTRTNREAATQYNDDWSTRGMQTDTITTTETGVQHPDDMYINSTATHHQVHSVRLNKFIQSAGQVMSVLLAESSRQSSATTIEAVMCKLCAFDEFKHHRIAHMTVAPSDPQMVAVVYPPLPTETRSVTLVYNIRNPQRIVHWLYCEGTVSSCVFSPYTPHLVFAGLHEGSICVWDLRESSTLHRLRTLSNNTQVVERHATFATHWLTDYNHCQPIVSMHILGADKQRRTANDDDDDMAELVADDDEGDDGGVDESVFQVASVDELGQVVVWSVVELQEMEFSQKNADDDDYALDIGGRVKLIRSNTMTPMCTQVSHAQFSSFDSNEVLMASQMHPVVHRKKRFGHPPSVTLYDTSAVCSMFQYHPTVYGFVLCACVDGSVRLFHVTAAQPLCVWPVSNHYNSIVDLTWSHVNPTTFFVLTTDSTIRTYSLQESVITCVSVENVKADVRHLMAWCLSPSEGCVARVSQHTVEVLVDTSASVLEPAVRLEHLFHVCSA